jgi:hypothetical protein
MHSRRKGWLALVAALAIVGVAVLVVGGPSGITALGSGDAIADARSHTDAPRTSTNAHAREGRRHADTTPSAPSPSQRSSIAPPDHDEAAHRAARRQAIVDAQRARDAQAEAALPSPSPPPSPALPGGLTKRVEGHDELLAELDRDFMPLAAECIDLARERDAELAGLLSMNFALIVDEQLGTIVESVDFPPEGNVADPQLHECLRESMLSMLLPPGTSNGRTALMLSLPVDADE